MSRLELLAKFMSHRFVKFLGVGGLNTLFGFAVYTLFALTELSTFMVLIVSTLAAITFNFFTTGGLVFRDLGLARVPRFLISYVVIFVINLKLIEWFSPLYGGRIWAMTIIVLPMALLSYFIQAWFVFGRPKESGLVDFNVTRFSIKFVAHLRKLTMKDIIYALSWREINSSHRLMTAIVIVLGVLNFFFGEIMLAGGGFGWDGVTYAHMTRKLESMVSNGQLSNYYAQRILPSAVVRSLFPFLDVSFNDRNIIRGFECYNLMLLVAATWVWKRIADNFSISLGGCWIGFCGLFLSFMASKQTFYYPVLTDVTALFVGWGCKP